MVLTKTLRKRAAAKLRKAYRLMNSAGAHWTKGYMATPAGLPENERYDIDSKNYDPKKCEFCSVGGYRHSCFGTTEPSDEQLGDPLYLAGLVALVKRVTRRKTIEIYEPLPDRPFGGSESITLRLDQLLETAEERDRIAQYPRTADILEAVVTCWNDSQRRSWEDIERTFLTTAGDLEKA